MPPAIDDKSVSDSNLSVVVGGKLVIQCPVTGIPPPKITWFKDKDIISPGVEPNYKLNEAGNRLDITTARLDDAGLFKCMGTNDAGNTTRNFNVDIHGN